MPRYDYQCGECGKEFEVTRRFDQSDDDVVCPDDHGPAQRLFRAPTIFVKGDGPALTRPSTRSAPGAGHSHPHGPGSHSH